MSNTPNIILMLSMNDLLSAHCILPILKSFHSQENISNTLLGKQIEISKSVWKDRSGGRGYGFVKTKVKKYICPLKNSALVAPNIYPSNIHSTSPSIGDIVEQREGLLHVSRNIPEHSSDNDGIRRLADRNSLKVRVRN